MAVDPSIRHGACIASLRGRADAGDGKVPAWVWRASGEERGVKLLGKKIIYGISKSV